MFSIEKTLEDIISFIKRIFFSFYIILLKPEKLIKEQFESPKLIKGSLYMLIAMTIFLAFEQLNIHIISESLDSMIRRYVSFFDNSEIGKNILYVIPLGFTVWVAVVSIGKLLLLKGGDLTNFKIFSFYWIGTGLILQVLINWINLFVLFIMPDETFPTWIINLIIKLLNYSAYLIPFIITLCVLIWKADNIQNRVRYKFIMTIPLIAGSSIFFCSIFFKFFIQYTELKSHSSIDIIGKRANHYFDFKENCIDTGCTSLQIDSKLYVRNLGSSAIFINKNDSFYIKAFRNEGDVEFSDTYQAQVEIKKMAGDSLSSLKILRPADIIELDCSINIRKEDWKKILEVTNSNTGIYQLLFQFHSNSIDNEKSYFNDDVFIMIE